MRRPRALLFAFLGVLTIAVVLGFIWPVSAGSCLAGGGWIDYADRICFHPDNSQPTRPLQHFYFAWLILLFVLSLLLAGLRGLVRAVRRSRRREP